MKNFSRWSIRLQLLSSLGLGAVIILLTSLFFSYQASKEYIKTESRLHAKDAATQMVRNLVSMTDDIETATLTLSVVTQYSRYSEDELSHLLKKIVANNQTLYGATIAIEPEFSTSKLGFSPYYYRLSNGDVVFIDLATPEYNYFEEVWYENAKITEGSFWSAPYFDEGGGDIYMTTFTVPIYKQDENNENSQFYGVVTGDLALDEINKKVQAINLSEGAYTLLLDNSLNIISGPKAEYFMRPLGEILGNVVKQKAWGAVLERMIRGEEGLQTLPCPHRNDQCLVAFLPLAINQWPLLIIYPEIEIYQLLDSHTIRYAFVAIFLVLLLIAWVTWLTQRLTQPLSILADVSSELGQGNFHQKLPLISTNAETNRLVLAFQQMQTALQRYVERLQQESMIINRLEGEMQAATQIQMEMLPGNGTALLDFPELSLWAHVVPAKSVGGDLYHYRMFQNKLTFIVGDVSDKGVPAALFMATTVSLFKQYSQQLISPDKILCLLNEALEEYNDACMFVTAYIGELNLETGDLIYSSAGHTPPILKVEGQLSELTQDTGPALGLVKNATYPIDALRMPVGGQLIIYTDGVDEAFNSNKEMYGTERLLKRIQTLGDHSTQGVGESIFLSVEEFSSGQDQSDDITVMVLEYKSKFSFLINDFITPLKPDYIRVAAKPGSLSQLTQAFETQLKHNDFTAYDLSSVRLVVEEVFVNALNHGSLSLDTVEFYFIGYDNHFLIEMIDSGIAFNPLEESPKPELGLEINEVGIGGLGVHLIKSMTIQCEYQRLSDKNHFCLLISCEASA